MFLELYLSIYLYIFIYLFKSLDSINHNIKKQNVIYFLNLLKIWTCKINIHLNHYYNSYYYYHHYHYYITEQNLMPFLSHCRRCVVVVVEKDQKL